MVKKYVPLIIASSTELNDLQLGKGSFFASVASGLNQAFDFDIEKDGKINLKLREAKLPSYSTLAEAQNQKEVNYKIIVEYDDETRKVAAIHDPYFTQSQGKCYRTEMSHLYFHAGKYSNSPIDRKRFFESISYGLLKEITMHNPAEKDIYKRGLALADLLLKNPPKESYKISHKPFDKSLEVLELLSKKTPIKYGKIKKVKEEDKDRNPIMDKLEKLLSTKQLMPQINLDDFTIEEINDALRNFGSFELVGPTIDKLRKYAEDALAKTKEILIKAPALSEAEQKAIENQGFNGFQDVREQSKARVAKGEGSIRNQIAWHFKPYLSPRAPEGINIAAIEEYYQQGMAVLQSFYRKLITILKVDPSRISPYENDTKSALSTRRYFAGKVGGTGIPVHSDYGRLTLVFSDQTGLEVQKKDGNWLPTEKLRFYINPGDWFRLQVGDPSFMPGIHRVPEIPEGRADRYSMALFLNPGESEKLTLKSKFMDLYMNFENKDQLMTQFLTSGDQEKEEEVTYGQYLENYRSSDASAIKVKVKKP
jgi:isopenicillin N synthase-like dioxygenase